MMLLARPKPGARGVFGSLVWSTGTATREVILPVVDKLSYALIVSRNIRFKVRSDDFAIEYPRVRERLAAYIFNLLQRKRDSALTFESLRIAPLGPKSARKTFAAVARRLRRSGTPLNGPAILRYPELLRGWPVAPEIAGRRVVGSPKIAVVLHLFFEEAWTHIAHVLLMQEIVFDLIVTLAPEKSDLALKITRIFPDAQIIITENRGRDVRPFLELLEQGKLDPYAYVCKIHGKRSADGGRQALLGEIWRNRMLFDLLGAPGAAVAHCDRFAAAPDVGMIGPRAYRYPSRLCSVERSWGENRIGVLELARRMGCSEKEFTLDFFCGTMFWVRPEALKPLRSLHLSKQFAPECGKIDGALEHFVERVFSTSVRICGKIVEDASGEDLPRKGDVATQSAPASETAG